MVNSHNLPTNRPSNHCIRGHRSTNCTHNDRPLFYIRKKGRPVSQCQQCRNLRKHRSLHTRCECPNRVQNRGQGGSAENADLPKGMTNQAARDYIERVNKDQGTILFSAETDLNKETVGNVILITVNAIQRLLPISLPHRPLQHRVPCPSHPIPTLIPQTLPP